MGYEIKNINPTKKTFTYALGKYDCYELRAGVCSLYLSEEQAKTISEVEGNAYGESNVMYCRTLAKKLLDINYYERPSFQEKIFSIRMHQRDCGHYVFTDGQHRTCIAKHLNIQSMYANIEKRNMDYEIICFGCREKEEEIQESKKMMNKIRNLLKIKRKSSESSYVIDEDTMNFKKDCSSSAFLNSENKI